MFQFINKLKLCTKLGPEAVHKYFYFHIYTSLFCPFEKDEEISKRENWYFFYTNTTVLGLIEKGLLSQEKCWFVAGICLIWKLTEYTNDNGPDAPLTPTF